MPESVPDFGNEAVEPPEGVEGIEGAELPGEGAPGIGEEVVPPGNEGVEPGEGDGEGIDGAPVPELGLPPLGSPDGLGVDGAPPPELVLQPLATSTAPMAIATSEARSNRAFERDGFIA